MCPKLFDLDDFELKDNAYDQSVLVAHNVKYHPVVTNKTHTGIKHFQLVKVFKVALNQFVIPFLQFICC